MAYSVLMSHDHCNEPSLNEVPWDLLGITFSYLDIHHQARAKRVSRMWSAVISECWPLEYVEINCQLGPDHCIAYPKRTLNGFDNGLDSREAEIDTMLYIALNERTKSLTLRTIELSHRRIILLIVERFKENKKKLPVLCFKDCTVETEIALYPYTNYIKFSPCNHGNLLLFNHHQPCKKVLLRNYTIRDIIDYDPLLLSDLPYIEGMMRKAGTSGTISRLVVDCRESAIQVLDSLLNALNADWPLVGENIRESVSALYGQWVKNNENPYKWNAVRNIVKLFTFHCDEPPYAQHPEHHEDVKSINIAQLNDMTVAFLSLLFKAYETNY